MNQCTGGKLTPKSVRVHVKVFAAPLLALESKEMTLELSEGATTEELLKSIPAKDKTYLYVVREGIRLKQTSELKDGDEILVIPPIAGG
jgi:molybdopterin converting factor small subunit